MDALVSTHTSHQSYRSTVVSGKYSCILEKAFLLSGWYQVRHRPAAPCILSPIPEQRVHAGCLRALHQGGIQIQECKMHSTTQHKPSAKLSQQHWQSAEN